MNLDRVSTEDLVSELKARADGKQQQLLPTDTTKNYLLLKRNAQGRFTKRK